MLNATNSKPDLIWKPEGEPRGYEDESENENEGDLLHIRLGKFYTLHRPRFWSPAKANKGRGGAIL